MDPNAWAAAVLERTPRFDGTELSSTHPAALAAFVADIDESKPEHLVGRQILSTSLDLATKQWECESCLDQNLQNLRRFAPKKGASATEIDRWSKSCRSFSDAVRKSFESAERNYEAADKRLSAYEASLDASIKNKVCPVLPADLAREVRQHLKSLPNKADRMAEIMNGISSGDLTLYSSVARAPAFLSGLPTVDESGNSPVQQLGETAAVRWARDEWVQAAACRGMRASLEASRKRLVQSYTDGAKYIENENAKLPKGSAAKTTFSASPRIKQQ